MNLHELLKRTSSDLTMAIAYVETAVKIVEKEEADAIAKCAVSEKLYADDYERAKEFRMNLEEIQCDLMHINPKVIYFKGGTMRIRCDWDWIKGYPIFVYTQWVEPNKFNVKLVRGVKGNQNAGNTGPSAPAWFEYVQKDYPSKAMVTREAFKIAKQLIEKEIREEAKRRRKILKGGI